MTSIRPHSGIVRWLLPSLVAVLGISLGVRIVIDRRSALDARKTWDRTYSPVPSSAPAHPPTGRVREPGPITLVDIPPPRRWSHRSDIKGKDRLDFSIDLDRFAPMGDGPANAALWFRDFSREDGSRASEVRPSDKIAVTLFGDTTKILPPDHPLLREAEPWLDQASCRFYPDVWELSGPDVIVPNFMFVIDLAKSWTARGANETDPNRAREDFRRAIRLGRLFMQDDVVMIQHLAGWTCVSYGLRGLNDLARREGDATMVAATSVDLGDYEAMRQVAARWVGDLSLADSLHKHWFGWSLSFDDSTLGRVVESARWSPLRCMRAESLYSLDAIAHEGTRNQRRTANDALEAVARDPDPRLARLANLLEQGPYVRSKYLSPPE